MLESKVTSFHVPLMPLANSCWRNPSSDPEVARTPGGWVPPNSGAYWPMYGAVFPFVPLVVGSKMSRVAVSANVVPIA